jgi:hypothetical protein
LPSFQASIKTCRRRPTSSSRWMLLILGKILEMNFTLTRRFIGGRRLRRWLAIPVRSRRPC